MAKRVDASPVDRREYQARWVKAKRARAAAFRQLRYVQSVTPAQRDPNMVRLQGQDTTPGLLFCIQVDVPGLYERHGLILAKSFERFLARNLVDGTVAMYAMPPTSK
jgi:hypothetical protein